ncbi:MAG TPA: MFS transporter [Pseudonocardiaceae bacterium]|nr:MFS transporter [Pseudonocardiaceae bacterium]
MALTASALGKVLPPRGPRRVLAAGTFVNSFGGGMFATSSALYFTRVVEFSADQVAIGLLAGSAIGLLAGMFVGQLADRYGPRGTQIGVMLFGAASMSCFLLVHTFVPFVLVCVCIGVTFAADQASRAPLIREFGRDEPAAYRAYLRSVTNLALALGILAAGIGIHLDTPTAYRTLIVARAAAFLGSALVQSFLPSLAPASGPERNGLWVALRDRTYLTATLLNCLMTTHHVVPTLLVPLWVANYTQAPRSLIAGMALINTLMIVALQVPLSRGVDNQRAAGQRMRWAGAALCAGLAVMAAAAGPGAWVAAGLLVAGAVLYTFGELWHSAGQMEWMFGLAPAHAQGQYAGVFGLGVGLGETLGPAMVSLCLHGGMSAWLLVGVGYLAVGLLSPPLVDRAARASARLPVKTPVPVT